MTPLLTNKGRKIRIQVTPGPKLVGKRCMFFSIYFHKCLTPVLTDQMILMNVQVLYARDVAVSKT